MMSSSALHQDDVVLAKLAVPKLPTDHVARPYLSSRFQKRLSWRIILVSALAGYGKTTLLSEWCHDLMRQEATYETAWFSVDEEDNDPIRFWRHFIASLATIWPDIESQQFLFLDTSTQFDASQFEVVQKSFVVNLSNYLFRKARLSNKAQVLFIDNIDLLLPDFFTAMINVFTGYFPPNIHIVAAGSHSPTNTFDAGRWDSVFQFPLTDLSFSRKELLAFMATRYGDAASEQLVHELYDFTYGWAQTVRAFSDSVETHELRNISKISKELLLPLADQFYEARIFAQIPYDLAKFLVHTSVTEKIQASLCDYLLERSDSQRIIQKLVKEGFFIERCNGDDDWYYYHPLFLHWLRTKLFQLPPNEIRGLSSRAQDWFERHHYATDAAKYMLMASDTDLIESLAASAHFRRPKTNESFVSWICNTPAQELAQSTTLSLHATWGYLCFGRVDDTLKWLSIFEGNLAILQKNAREEINPEDLHAAAIVVEHITIKCKEFRGHYRESIVAYKKLLSEQESMSLSLRIFVVHAIAESYERVGEFNLALEYYLQTEAIADLTRSPFFVAFGRYAFGWILAFKGELRNAEEVCLRALEDCPVDFTLYGALHSLLAYIKVEKGCPNEAGPYISKAMKHLSSSRNADMLFEAKVVRARYLATIGEYDEAYRLIVQTVLQVEHAGFPRAILSFAYVAQAEIALSRGNLVDMISVHDKLLRQVDSEDVRYVLSRKLIESCIHYQQEKYEDALAIADEVLKGAEISGLNIDALEACLLKVLAYKQQGKESRAFTQLIKALNLGSRRGIIGPFLRYGEPIQAMLSDIINTRKTDGVTQNFIKTLLKKSKAAEIREIDPSAFSHGNIIFTKRESEVLALLNTGMSRQEIAETLKVSHNTVKTHLNNIYTKLGVKSRSEVFQMSSKREEGV